MQFKCILKSYVQGYFLQRRSRQKSKTGSVGDEAQCSTVLCFLFLDFLIFTCAKASCCKCLSIAFMTVILHLVPHSTQHVDKPEQESGVSKFIRHYWTAIALKYLKLGSPMRKCVYLLEFILKHYSSCWDPSLRNQTVKHSSLLLPEITSLRGGGSGYKEAAANEIFFSSVNK